MAGQWLTAYRNQVCSSRQSEESTWLLEGSDLEHDALTVELVRLAKKFMVKVVDLGLRKGEPATVNLKIHDTDVQLEMTISDQKPGGCAVSPI